MAHVWYEAGNEHNPADPFGRVTLEVEPGGELRLSRHSREGAEAWTARVEPAFFDHLTGALRTAGFPKAPSILPSPDDRLRDLRITGSGAVLLPWYEAADLPGYAEAFALLDGVVAQVTGLDLRVGPPPSPATDVVRVDPVS
ncbi:MULTISPECIES: hypothetical protein [unclassified Amycolatopsis]|uniref:hypothetical protein n=1 Tax=unclassified Amycolatopsis TaxID=2618356 RepID=UPI0028770072|nr:MULTISPECIES: hypothetical protein [unclassified Amycolatopsis]MDS0140334.1 hypothetical protein [Amycolatopsis sp. 505]MDS0149062.1 hypothetical protein [Amycolatopsis sp. CM201R]